MQNKGFWRRWSLKLARFAGISLFLAALSLVTGTASASANNTLSGTFKDSLGNPVPGASVYLVTGTGATTTGTVTSTGTYSVSVPAGTYTLGFSTNSVVTASATIPPGEFFSSSGHSVNLTAGNITQDFAMNLAPISVTVLDQFGMPLSNNRICAQASGGTADMGPAAGTFSSVTLRPAQYSACRPITDTLGHATIYLPVGMTISQLIAVPATGSAFATFNIGTITGSASVNIQQPATRTFSGVFRDGAGNPVKGLIMSITSPVAGANTGVITGTDGVFNLSLPAYGYQLGVTCCQTGTNPFPAIPSGNFSTSGTVPVDLTAGNITSDLSFDLAPLTVTVLMADGTPAANTALNVAGSGTIALNPLGQIAATLGVYGSTSDAAPYEPITNSSGQAVVWVPKNMTLTTIEAILPLSNPAFTDSRPGYDSPVSLNITGPASATVQLPTLRSFQGTFRDGLGQPVNGATVNLVGTT